MHRMDKENEKEKKDDMHGIKQKHKDIYGKYPSQYHAFKCKQDHQNNLLPALLSILPVNKDKVSSNIPQNKLKITYIIRMCWRLDVGRER